MNPVPKYLLENYFLLQKPLKGGGVEVEGEGDHYFPIVTCSSLISLLIQNIPINKYPKALLFLTKVLQEIINTYRQSQVAMLSFFEMISSSILDKLSSTPHQDEALKIIFNLILKGTTPDSNEKIARALISLRFFYPLIFSTAIVPTKDEEIIAFLANYLQIPHKIVLFFDLQELILAVADDPFSHRFVVVRSYFVVPHHLLIVFIHLVDQFQQKIRFKMNISHDKESYQQLSFSSLMKLPTIIFSLIQEYLIDRDYFHLMNCNRSAFAGIKFETIRYCIKINEEDMNSLMEVDILKDVNTKVRYSRRQLKLHMDVRTQFFMESYATMFSNIYELKVILSSQVSLEGLDFSIFNNIYRVHLKGFKGIQSISKGLENIHDLEIANFRDLVSIDCPLIGFRKIKIISCYKLTSLPMIQRTQDISIVGSQLANLDLSQTEDYLRSLQYRYPVVSRNKRDLSLIQGISYQLLQVLSIHDLETRNVRTDFSVFAHIPSVSIECNTRSHHVPFPVFYGKILHLLGVDLSLWKEEMMGNLRELKLSDCSNCRQLPCLPNVTKITLFKMHQITDISPTLLPNVTSMWLQDCAVIRRIQRFPKIKSVTIGFCVRFEGFDGYNQSNNDAINQRIILNSLKLHSLPMFDDIPSLPETYELSIFDCPEIKSFDGFDRSSFKRKVWISGLNAVNCDMKGLGNIYELVLNDVSDLIDGKGIHDIDHLMIYHPKNLLNFSNFHGINQSILLLDVSSLKSFDGLQSIPRLALIDIHSAIEDFNGLRNCGQILAGYGYGKENTVIKEAEKYLADKSSSSFGEIFESIKEFYILTGVAQGISIDKSFSEEKIRLW